MANELPYYKFNVAEWLTGDIVFEPLNVQGLFINICAVYWQRSGKLSLDDIKKRWKNPPELKQLTDRFFSVNDGFISISFLEEQFQERKVLSTTNSKNGSLGGRPKVSKTKGKKPTANRPLTEPKANESNIEKRREEKNENIHPIQKYISDSCSNISKLKTQLKEEDCKKLLASYSKELIYKKILAMENKKDLTKKYSSVYLTLNNWCSMETERTSETPLPEKESLAEREARLTAENHP